MVFTHCLVTRINLGYKERILRQGHDEDSWLDYRFSIFYKFCFPSVVNQIDKNFIWLIYIDDRTPLPYIQELFNRTELNSNIVVLKRSGGFDDIGRHFAKDIMQYVDRDSEYLITTRVDSDDLIHSDYLCEIKALFNFQEYASINFTYGWVYDDRIKLLGKAKNMSNPFISLVEKIPSDRSVRTVFYQSHTDYIHESNRVEITNKKRLWCMTIHGVNDSTRFYGLPIYRKLDKLSDNFSFPLVIKPNVRLFIYFSYKYYRRQAIKVFPYLVRKQKK